MSELAFWALVLMFLILTLGFRLAAVERRLARLQRLEGKIDALLQHAGLPTDSYAGLPDAVKDAVRRRKRIEAMALLRERGMHLREAKEIVDDAMRAPSMP